MIKHEEARKAYEKLQEIILITFSLDVYLGECDTVTEYLKQQEKVSKLLKEVMQEIHEIRQLQLRNEEISKIIYGDWGFPQYKSIEVEYNQNVFKIQHYDFNKLLEKLEASLNE